jgi:hypothetical protein
LEIGEDESTVRSMVSVACQKAKGRVRRRPGRFEKRWQAAALQKCTTSYTLGSSGSRANSPARACS